MTTNWMRRSPKLVAVVGFLVATAIAGPSAADAAKARPDAEALRERAEAYWTARVARDETVYEFYPEEGRDDVSEFGNITYLEYSIDEVNLNVDGNEATVVVQARIQIPLPAGMKRGPGLDRLTKPVIRETWDKADDGTWYKRPTGRSLARFQKSLRSSRGAAAGTAKTVGGKEESAAAEGNADAAKGAPAPARPATSGTVTGGGD